MRKEYRTFVEIELPNIIAFFEDITMRSLVRPTLPEHLRSPPVIDGDRVALFFCFLFFVTSFFCVLPFVVFRLIPYHC